MATRGDFYLATSGDFVMAMDNHGCSAHKSQTEVDMGLSLPPAESAGHLMCGAHTRTR
jgi:hypothetical protein